MFLCDFSNLLFPNFAHNSSFLKTPLFTPTSGLLRGYLVVLNWGASWEGHPETGRLKTRCDALRRFQNTAEVFPCLLNDVSWRTLSSSVEGLWDVLCATWRVTERQGICSDFLGKGQGEGERGRE